MALTLMLKLKQTGIAAIQCRQFRARRDDTMEDRRAFLIEGKWELDGIEDQQDTRVVQAIDPQPAVHEPEGDRGGARHR